MTVTRAIWRDQLTAEQRTTLGRDAGVIAEPRPDVLVIGGGINGAGITRDAAGREFSALLAEKDDLAPATSSCSSKLIHGGLRYLERNEFRLVAESLAEREVLLKIAGHLVSPLQFVMPHVPELRPRWMIRAGLFLYDHLGGRHILPGTQVLDLRLLDMMDKGGECR